MRCCIGASAYLDDSSSGVRFRRWIYTIELREGIVGGLSVMCWWRCSFMGTGKYRWLRTLGNVTSQVTKCTCDREHGAIRVYHVSGETLRMGRQ